MHISFFSCPEMACQWFIVLSFIASCFFPWYDRACSMRFDSYFWLCFKLQDWLPWSVVPLENSATPVLPDHGKRRRRSMQRGQGAAGGPSAEPWPHSLKRVHTTASTAASSFHHAQQLPASESCAASTARRATWLQACSSRFRLKEWLLRRLHRAGQQLTPRCAASCLQLPPPRCAQLNGDSLVNSCFRIWKLLTHSAVSAPVPRCSTWSHGHLKFPARPPAWLPGPGRGQNVTWPLNLNNRDPPRRSGAGLR